MMLKSLRWKIKSLVKSLDKISLAQLNAVGKKTPRVSDLAKRTDYDSKASDIDSKYFAKSV